MTQTPATITVSDRVEIPAEAITYVSPIGTVCGLTLRDGRLVRPWITWEIEETGGPYRDLTFDELLALGFQPGLETTITIDVD